MESNEDKNNNKRNPLINRRLIKSIILLQGYHLIQFHQVPHWATLLADLKSILLPACFPTPAPVPLASMRQRPIPMYQFLSAVALGYAEMI